MFYEECLVLHSLHGQFSGFHLLIYVLKELTSSNSFNVLGTKFYILGVLPKSLGSESPLRVQGPIFSVCQKRSPKCLHSL